jgi:hypothetical protein
MVLRRSGLCGRVSSALWRRTTDNSANCHGTGANVPALTGIYGGGSQELAVSDAQASYLFFTSPVRVDGLASAYSVSRLNPAKNQS